MFIDKLVYLIVFHKGKFKAKSYFFRYSNFSFTPFVSALSFALCFINFHLCERLLEKYYGVNKKLTPNVSTWTWYWSGENPWVPYRKWQRIWVYMLIGWTLGWALGMYGLGLLVQIIIIIIFFELVSLCTTSISETVYLFSNVYIHSSSFIKNNFWENLPERIFCALVFESNREKKT